MLPCQEADVFRNGNLWCVKTYWKSYDKIVGGIRCDTGKVTLLMCLIHLSFFLYRWVWAYLSQDIYLFRVMLWIYIFMPINYLFSPPYYSALFTQTSVIGPLYDAKHTGSIFMCGLQANRKYDVYAVCRPTLVALKMCAHQLNMHGWYLLSIDCTGRSCTFQGWFQICALSMADGPTL